MTKTFTHDDVIRYIYEEVDNTEKAEIESAMLCDISLQNTYKELSAVKKQLDHSLNQPSNKVIQSIMNYSKSLNLSSKE